MLIISITHDGSHWNILTQDGCKSFLPGWLTKDSVHDYLLAHCGREIAPGAYK